MNNFRTDLKKYVIPENSSINDAIKCINDNKNGIALVVNKDFNLKATITDADLRKAIYKNININSPIQVLINAQKGLPFPTPVTAPSGITDYQSIQIMQKYEIRHLPVLNDSGKLTDLIILDELVPKDIHTTPAVIMAGGFGKRLMPLTKKVPKPMLPVKGKPILEYVIKQLKISGINEIIITTHYLRDIIKNHFKNGKMFGVDISYLDEQSPLGTAGILKNINIDGTVLVVNSDILTDFDFNSIISFHKKENAKMTIGIKLHEINIPYGVFDFQHGEIDTLNEKPTFYFNINAGIYVLESEILNYIPPRTIFNMTDLISLVKKKNIPSIAYPIYGYWRDIGNHDDYNKVQNDDFEK